MPYILRKGKDWCNPSGGPVVDRFHAIAKQYGSSARWLCQSCTLATDSQEEIGRNFPYEKWRDCAMR